MADLEKATLDAIAEVSQQANGALRVKMHDKHAALVSLGKHLGLFTERANQGRVRHSRQADDRRGVEEAIRKAVAVLQPDHWAWCPQLGPQQEQMPFPRPWPCENTRRALIVCDFKEMDRLPRASGFSAIQNNSDVSQGLSPRLAAQSTTRAVGILMPLWSRSEQIKVAGDPRFDWAIRRCAMKMSATQFVVPPAIVGRSRSVWHEIIDTVTGGPPRTAADEIAEYLARHQYDLSPMLRIELERRHVCL